ncbi:hypothetical protein [Nocardia heshunensis]
MDYRIRLIFKRSGAHRDYRCSRADAERFAARFGGATDPDVIITPGCAPHLPPLPREPLWAS